MPVSVPVLDLWQGLQAARQFCARNEVRRVVLSQGLGWAGLGTFARKADRLAKRKRFAGPAVH